MKQRDVFLESEGDAWFVRNSPGLKVRKLPESDPILQEILKLPAESVNPGTRVLEIGCGDGSRLTWLKERLRFECYGIDPSRQAVRAASERGVNAQQGTADHLPFDDGALDMVIFGFCLYLCDREDLFRIACEADRVLRNPGWILIQDFYSRTPIKREYHHRSGIFSYKMDCQTLFTWSPAYTTLSQRIMHHSEHTYTDDRQEWVAVSVLRKALEQ